MRTLARMAFALLIGCAPDFGVDASRVSAARLLAVQGTPAEAAPGAPVSYTALVAVPEGVTDVPMPIWRFCTAPKPAAENDVVSPMCLDAASLVNAGTGIRIVAAVPSDACARFGPDTPPGDFRPRDPDVTGGYYQPLRVDLPDASPLFHLSRLLCGLAGAPDEVVRLFASEYVPNENPHLEPLRAVIDGAETSLRAVPRGARVELTASWPASDAEHYVAFDPALQALVTRREAMRVAWYTDAGELATESSGRAGDDSETTVANVWSAPSRSGAARLWVVLRDDRGGLDFETYDVSMTP